jgi:hypothetical protein
MTTKSIDTILTELQKLEIGVYSTLSITQRDIIMNATDEELGQLAHAITANVDEASVLGRLINAKKELGGIHVS